MPDLKRVLDIVSQIPAIPSILDIVCRTTGMGFSAMARVTETRWVACAVQDNIGFGLKPGEALDVETTLCNEVREHRQIVVIDDVSTDPVYCGRYTPQTYGLRSYISVPILLQDGTFFGTLCAIDPSPQSLKKSDVVGMFKLFAELIGFHLDAHYRVAAVQASLDREREVAELREQFIAVVGHDLRNPLAAVAAGTRSIARHPERAAELAVHVERSIGRMSGLIDNVLDFARGRLGGGLALAYEADVALASVLTQVVQELRSVHPDRIIEVDMALEQPVRCDPRRIAQLLSNLLGNALTHGADQPIAVQAQSAQGVFSLSVANKGEPIEPATMEKLFQPFSRGKVTPGQEGLGLGLFIASEIARAHGGGLEVSSTPEETRFTLRMPNGV